MIQRAKVEHSIPFWTFIHECKKCDYKIMESDWIKVKDPMKGSRIDTYA